MASLDRLSYTLTEPSSKPFFVQPRLIAPYWQHYLFTDLIIRFIRDELLDTFKSGVDFFVFQSAVCGAKGHGERKAFLTFGETLTFVEVKNTDAFTGEALGGLLGKFGDLLFDITCVDGLINNEC